MTQDEIERHLISLSAKLTAATVARITAKADVDREIATAHERLKEPLNRLVEANAMLDEIVPRFGLLAKDLDPDTHAAYLCDRAAVAASWKQRYRDILHALDGLLENSR